jgi:hypothetical protein
MAEYLNGYLDENLTQQISEGDNSNPIDIAIDTTTDNVVEVPIWLKNEATAGVLKSITVTTDNVPDGTPLTFSFALDNNGTPDTYSETLSVPDMNPSDVVKIWWKVEAPANTLVNYSSIKIKAHYLVELAT